MCGPFGFRMHHAFDDDMGMQNCTNPSCFVLFSHREYKAISQMFPYILGQFF